MAKDLDGIWIIGAEAKTAYANERMAENSAEMIGQTSFAYLFPEDVAEAQRLFEAKTRGDTKPFRFKLRRADGTNVTVSGRARFRVGLDFSRATRTNHREASAAEGMSRSKRWSELLPLSACRYSFGLYLFEPRFCLIVSENFIATLDGNLRAKARAKARQHETRDRHRRSMISWQLT